MMVDVIDTGLSVLARQNKKNKYVLTKKKKKKKETDVKIYVKDANLLCFFIYAIYMRNVLFIFAVVILTFRPMCFWPSSGEYQSG